MEDSDAEIDDLPLYSKRRQRLIRAFVLITVGAMMLPLVANLFTVSASAAAKACMTAVTQVAPDAKGYSSPFQIFGPGGVGWECYATGTFGGDRHIVSLGLLPGLVSLPHGGTNA